MNANRTHFFLLVSFTIVLFSLINLFIKTIPLTFAHAVYFCQQILSNAIVFPHSTPFIILLFLSLIFFIGLIALTVQFLKTKVFIKQTFKKSIGFPKKLRAIVKNLYLENKIDVIENKSHISFCYGLFRPRICLSTALIASLNSDELKAVLLHEGYHLKNHDPLRILLGKTASLMLFFIPTLKDIQSHYIFSKEIAADEVVIRNGSKESLISALAKLLSPSIPTLSGVAAFASSNNLEKRIIYLTEQKKLSIRLSKKNLLLSTGVMVLFFIALNAPVHAITVNKESMEHTYFVCPFGGECLNSCKNELKTTSKNYSEYLMYTPIQ